MRRLFCLIGFTAILGVSCNKNLSGKKEGYLPETALDIFCKGTGIHGIELRKEGDVYMAILSASGVNLNGLPINMDKQRFRVVFEKDIIKKIEK